MDEEARAKQGVSPFRIRLRESSKKEISCIEEENLLPLPSDLRDERGFLGEAAKGTSESAAGLDLTQHIVRIDNDELNLGCGVVVMGANKTQDQSRNEKDPCPATLQLSSFLSCHRSNFGLRTSLLLREEKG